MREELQPSGTAWEIVGNIGVLSLDNPPGNALNNPEFIPLDYLKTLLDSDSICGLVITGCGRHFSSGADETKLFQMARDPRRLFSGITGGRALLDYISQVPIPVIAAIRGVCFGGGLEIALAAHIRISTEKALFSYPEANLKLMPGLNGPYRTVRLIGESRSLSLMLSGEAVDAESALSMGLVDQLVSGKDVRAEALTYLENLTRDRPIEVIHSIVRSVNNAGIMAPQDAMDAETRMFCHLAAAEEMRRSGKV